MEKMSRKVLATYYGESYFQNSEILFVASEGIKYTEEHLSSEDWLRVEVA